MAAAVSVRGRGVGDKAVSTKAEGGRKPAPVRHLKLSGGKGQVSRQNRCSIGQEEQQTGPAERTA